MFSTRRRRTAGDCPLFWWALPPQGSRKKRGLSPSPRLLRTLLLGIGRLLAAFLLAILASNACSAAIIITAPTVNLPYSSAAQSGSFEVYVQSTATSPPQVGADNIELQLPATPGVTFTLPANATPTSHLYLFHPQTPASLILKSGQIVEGTDFAPSSLPTLVNGSGLLLVDYQVAAGAFGNFPLTLVGYPAPQSQIGTALFDGSNNPLSATLQNGSINISAPVPEPAAWMLALVAALGTTGYLWRTRLAALFWPSWNRLPTG